MLGSTYLIKGVVEARWKNLAELPKVFPVLELLAEDVVASKEAVSLASSIAA